MKTIVSASREPPFPMPMNEIPPTFKHAVLVWWAYLLRIFLTVVVTFLAGGMTFISIGFLLVAFGVPLTTVKLLVIPFGAVAGLMFLIFPIYLILGKEFRTFRLILVSKEKLDSPFVFDI